MAERRSAENDFNALSGFIQWLGLEGEEAEKFVTEAMTRRGHKPVTSWADGDGDGGEKKEPTNVLGLNFGGSQQKKASGSGWQYGG